MTDSSLPRRSVGQCNESTGICNRIVLFVKGVAILDLAAPVKVPSGIGFVDGRLVESLSV